MNAAGQTLSTNVLVASGDQKNLSNNVSSSLDSHERSAITTSEGGFSRVLGEQKSSEGGEKSTVPEAALQASGLEESIDASELMVGLVDVNGKTLPADGELLPVTAGSALIADMLKAGSAEEVVVSSVDAVTDTEVVDVDTELGLLSSAPQMQNSEKDKSNMMTSLTDSEKLPRSISLAHRPLQQAIQVSACQ